MDLSTWLNKTSMTSLRSLCIAIVFLVMMLVFTGVAAWRMTDNSASAKIVAPDLVSAVQLAATAQTRETSRHNAGKGIMDALLTLIGVAMGISAGSQFGDRKTSREHMEGQANIEREKEKGRVTGVAAVAAAAQLVETTKEHAALLPVKETELPDLQIGETKNQWADDREHAGIL